MNERVLFPLIDDNFTTYIIYKCYCTNCAA